MIGLGPSSELARPSTFGTGRTGDDRGEQYVRKPRASGQAQPGRSTPGRPDMPTAGPPVDDYQPPGSPQAPTTGEPPQGDMGRAGRMRRRQQEGQ